MKRIIKAFLVFLVLLINTTVFSQNKQQIKVGQTIPNFVLKSLTGEKHSLSDFRHRKMVYLNFFNTGSARTKRDIAELSRICALYSKKNVEVLGIAVNEKAEKLLFFVKEFSIPYPILLDSDGMIRKAYNLKILPQSIIIDRKGIVRYVGLTPPENFKVFLKGLKPKDLNPKK
ncbi:MAG: hypothetical protein A3J83_00605 [Elusimicrobia bacterium RIFOXYA2_FULL_40_6]|nr:MAG: hypothetical protein A3J83_00605 [Elusimicrobia bacterium RIFOXYA2_FULL_40_6]